MKALATLSLITILGMGGTYLAIEPIPTPVPIVQLPQETIAPLEIARKATFDIVLDDYGTAGSAILVGRVKLENGNYRYRALTAYHVVEAMAKTWTSQSMTMTFQPEFHGPYLQFVLDVEDIDWAIPAHDWASFTFESEHKLECVEIASKLEFESIKAFEPIYIVACKGGGYGQQCGEGIISTTHNTGIFPKQQAKSEYAWNKHPNKFFRISPAVWFGDSGGAVFNKDGKLIGIINGLTIGDGWGNPVPHSAVSLKTYIILDVTQHSKDFFKIED